MNLKAVGKIILMVFAVNGHLFAQDQSAIESHSFQEGDATINYLMCGDKSEVTVLFVHGWCIDASYWMDQLTSICAQNEMQAVAIDLPAHGKSSKSQRVWTPQAFGADVAALIDHLKLNNVILVGHSMGGDIVLEAASKRPQKVIGLIGIDNFKDAGVPLDAATSQAMEQFLESLATNYTATVNFFASEYLFSQQTDDASKQRVVNSILQSDSVIASEILTELFVYSPQEIPKLNELGKKLYLINSDVTPTIGTHLQAQNIDFEVVDIAGTGHYPMIEKPEEFNELLHSTIEKLMDELEN